MITKMEVESIISVDLRYRLRRFVPIIDEMCMTIIIEYKHLETGEITTIREVK